MSRPAVRAIVADVEAQIARLERRDVPSVRLVRRTLSRTLAKVDAAVVLAVAVGVRHCIGSKSIGVVLPSGTVKSRLPRGRAATAGVFIFAVEY